MSMVSRSTGHRLSARLQDGGSESASQSSSTAAMCQVRESCWATGCGPAGRAGHRARPGERRSGRAGSRRLCCWPCRLRYLPLRSTPLLSRWRVFGSLWGCGLEGRGFVSTDHVSEQFGEGDRRLVFVERAHDLRADWESARRTPYGRSYGGQAWQRRVRHPEGLAIVGSLPFGRRDRALFEGSGVMWEGRREVHRAQEHVDVVKVAVPGGTGRHAAVFVFDELRERCKVLTRLLKGEERLHVESERFVVLQRVHAVGPAFDDCRAGSVECVHGVG